MGCEQNVTQLPARDFSKIVFLSNRESINRHFDIFIMQPDGSEQRNLTKGLKTIRTNSRPVLSPDQSKIIYVGFEIDSSGLQILDLETNKIDTLVWLKSAPDAEFSPQGEYLTFVQKIDKRRQIHTINADGTKTKNLSKNSYDEYNPSYSPDGRHIVYVSKRKDKYVICVMNLKSFEKKDVYSHNGKLDNPVFNSDGSLIAFSSMQNGISDIFLLTKNGENVVNVTKRKSQDRKPKFLPNGTDILFLSDERGVKYQDICRVNMDNLKIQNLTKSLSAIHKNVNITPDGKMIIFDSIKYGNSDIYKLELESGEFTNLTNHPGWDQASDI